MMQIYKILDRFELLYPDDERVSNLRRAYVDRDLYTIFKIVDAPEDLRKAILEKNMHSLFRIIGDQQISGSADDLRAAVIDQNMYAIFRLLSDADDLKKAVCNDNIHSIYRLINAGDIAKIIEYDNYWVLFDTLQEYTKSQFVAAFRYMYNEKIEFEEDCFSRGQLESKLWLINELVKADLDLGVIFLCAGWYGTLATMMFENNLKFEKIRNFDIDPTTEKIAEIFNSPWVIDGWKFKHVEQDIHDIDFEEHCYTVSKSENDFEALWDSPDTIINTSCEHIENFSDWYGKIPKGKLVVLQSNDYMDIEEHVNCSPSLKDFSISTPMETVIYEGELGLHNYTRFMKIGYK
jgi:hypothetical protein